MKEAYYSDLAIAFIQGRLSLQEKQLVFPNADGRSRIPRVDSGLNWDWQAPPAGLKTGAPSTLKRTRILPGAKVK